MAEIDVLKAQLVRDDASKPWGFRLQGGDAAPLSIARIRPGSPADRIGLRQGDEVTEIGDSSTAAMTHEAANELIKQYGLSLILTIERRARGAAAASAPQQAPQPVPQRVPQPVPQGIPQSVRSTGAPVRVPFHAPAQQPNQPIYQPYDMTGKPAQVVNYPQVQVRSVPRQAPASRPAPARQPQAPVDPNLEYQTASSRVYDPPPMTGPRYQPPPPPAQPLPEPQTFNPAPSTVDGQRYIPEEDKLDGPVQSRTFKILQSLMENEDYKKASGPMRMPTRRTADEFLYDEDPVYNGIPVQSRSFQALSSNVLPHEEPYAGSSGLPPPRSAHMEEWKRQEAAKRDSPRVKVFMPQSYNTPLGLYATENIMDSFQKQAGAAMDQMDQLQPDNVSGAQRAVMEQEFNPPGASDL